MNLLEFKRRLMTDPGARSAEMRAERARDDEFAAAADASNRFEIMLHRAVSVPVPHGLAEQIILRQSLEQQNAKPAWRGILAIAAALALAVALTTFNLVERNPTMPQMAEHIAWHWQHDGPQTLATASGELASDTDQVRRVFSELGVHIEPALLAKVRLTKFCPTPDGAGAHVVLATEQGPITLYYMPRTRIPSSPASIPLADGMQSMVVNLERGSMALVAEAGADMPELAREITHQLSFAPGMTI
ncbi:MAG: DUF3379 domain-containing protein [Xanthomonadaceae bacterium]|nr:DUF3379 domain-containing protein [Xanthomonadaceae bacterium]